MAGRMHTLSHIITRSTSVSSSTSLRAALDLRAGAGRCFTYGSRCGLQRQLYPAEKGGYRRDHNYQFPNVRATGGLGQRVTPANSVAMPRIVSANGSAALATVPGAHHYRVVGVEFTTPAGAYYNGGIVQLRSGNGHNRTALPMKDRARSCLYSWGCLRRFEAGRSIQWQGANRAEFVDLGHKERLRTRKLFVDGIVRVHSSS